MQKIVQQKTRTKIHVSITYFIKLKINGFFTFI